MKTLIALGIALSLLQTAPSTQASQEKEDSREYLTQALSRIANEINHSPDNNAAKHHLEKLVAKTNQTGKLGYSAEPYNTVELQTIRCGEERRFNAGSVTYCYDNKGTTMNFMMLFTSKGLDKTIPAAEDITIMFHDENANSISANDFIRTARYENSRKLGHTLTNQGSVKHNLDVTNCHGVNKLLESTSYKKANLAFALGGAFFIEQEARARYVTRLGKSVNNPNLGKAVEATISRTVQEFTERWKKYKNTTSSDNCF